MQFAWGLFAREFPVDSGAVAVDAALPSMNFAAQCRQVTDSALSQTLAAEQAHFDLVLVKPTTVLGCVMHREAVPQRPPSFSPYRFPSDLRPCVFRLSITCLVDGPRFRIAGDDPH